MPSFVSDFTDLMSTSVGVKARASYNNYGEASYSTSTTTVECRWVESPVQIRDANGNTVEARGMLWLASTGTITPEHRITLPDGTSPPILRVDRLFDENGVSHHKCWVGY